MKSTLKSNKQIVPRRISLRPLIAFVALLLTTTLAHADVYRWVDSQGRVQYSDQPPAGIDAQRVSAKPAAGTQVPATVKGYQEQDQEFRKRRVEEAERAGKDASVEQQAKAKQKYCGEAKAQLASLQNGGRIVRTDEKGEREYLDDKSIGIATADAKKAVADWCK